MRFTALWMMGAAALIIVSSLSGATGHAAVEPLEVTAPSILASPVSIGVVSGKRATFTVLAEGVPGGSPLSYQWYFGEQAIAGAAARRATFSVIASAAREGAYRVEVANANGSVFSEAAVLTLYSKPKITVQPRGGTYDAEGALTLSVAANGTPAPSFQWFAGDEEIPGATQAEFAIESLSALDTGTYKVRVSNEVGSVVSRPVSVVVRSAPELVVSPSIEGLVLAGKTVKLQVVAVGYPKRSYQWRLYGEPIRGARSATYAFKATMENAGVYDVVVSNALGEVISEGVDVVVNTVPKFTIQPVSQVVEPGGSANFHAFAASFPTPSYQWFRNGVPIPGATRTFLDAYQTGDANDVEYTVVATNPGGVTTSAVAKLIVNLPPASLRVGNIFTLSGKFIDNDKDTSRVDESYAVTSDGWFYYTDRVSGEVLGMTYEYTRTGPKTATVVARATFEAGRKLKLKFNYTFQTPTSGTYKMSLSSNFDFSGTQSGAFTLVR